MYIKIRNSFAFLIFLLFLALPVATLAQQTTGSVQGTVKTPNGGPAVGEVVTVTDTRTGTTRVSRTNDNGAFAVRDLIVGGPYTIRVDSDTYRGTIVTDVFTNLSGASVFNITLEEQGAIEEVLVVASSTVAVADLAIGPSSSFNFEEISAMPTISRNIRDIIRLDPRVNVGRAAGGNGFGISCLGGSVKTNSFTIDGVRSADGFGLNASGNSARATFAVPFDAVRSAAVEFSPIDVQYGQFTGCNINVVTKSGSNDFFGSAFYLYNDDSLTGDTLNGNTVITEPFEDTDWGFEIGGPIIKDTLFFYLAYEETDEGGTQNNGPIGGGFANEGFITVEEAALVKAILISKYDRDPGDIVRTLPKFSERQFARIDWNINDSHRLEASYVSLEELAWDEDDYGRFGGFTFSDNFELQGTDSDSYSVRLFSNWTDNFSTEARFSSLDVADIQGPVGGGEAQETNIPRIVVFNEDGDFLMTSGPGIFRSANDLQYTLDQFKLAGTYVTGDHELTAGYELDALDVFNLFVINATGEFQFDSVEDLDAGIASDIFGAGSFTGDINDAAASFSRDIDTFYIQDVWTASDRLTVTAGLRYDKYSSSDSPIENPVWKARYGFSNTQSFDGLDILQPRIGLTYDLPWNAWGEIQLRAGFGIFSGGDPTVHFANAFQNFGGAIGNSSVSGSCDASELDVLSSGTFNGIPQCITDGQIAQATQNTGRAAAVDPNFDLPSQERYNFGLSLFSESSIDFFDGWDINFDYIYSNAKNAPDWIDVTLTQRVDEDGNLVFLPDGRPQFFAVDPLLEGCDATFIGLGEGFANVTAACDAGRDDQDTVMTNGVSGSTTSISIQGGKSFYFGEKTTMDIRLGYAYTDAKVGNPVNSSTDTSSFEEVAVAVINDVQLGPALWANKHNIVIGATFKHYFFEDHPTSIGIFFRSRSGRPFSYAYDNNTPTSLFGDSDNEERNLFYVPTGPDDPLIDFSRMENPSSGGDVGEFFDWMKRKGLDKYAGRIIPKNAFNHPWNTDMDIRIAQDIPLPSMGPVDHRLRFFFDIENILNLFSDSKNIQTFFSTGDVAEGLPVLDAALSADGTQFVYSNFTPGGSKEFSAPFNPRFFDVDDSVWRIQLGIRYEFY